MSFEIIAEDFSLTDAIKENVQTQVDAIHKLVDATKVSVYLTEPAKGQFAAKFVLHAMKKDFFAEDQSDDLYRSLLAARHQLCRQLNDAKKIFIAKRHA